MKTYYLAFLVAACAAMPQSYAAVIAQYDFNTTDVLSAISADANVTAYDFTEGSSFAASSNAGWSSSTNLFARGLVTTGGGSGSLSTAISVDDYFSFIIDPDAPGAVMSLTSLDLNYGYTRAGGFDGKTFTAELLTSIDGFTASDSVALQSVSTDPPTATPSYTSWSIDLSGPSFQNITTATEFRFYLYDDTSDSNTIHRLDDIVLNGIVTVPEPSSTALVGLGGLALMLRRKRS